MTAIEKMVEWWDRLDKSEEWDNPEDELMAVYSKMRHLADEEAKEKPSALASLLEFAKREIKMAREQGNGSSFQDGRIYAFEEIISRYRPSSTEEMVVYRGSSKAKSCHCIGPDKCGNKNCELVRKYSGAQ